ncbi:hypothetical protein R5O87_17720 [Arthrobacter globiformis]|uniref:hypothetical protein n=1 Tax=Arthrobacter globiformis TaxID=1665 RepID=UPI00397C0A5C
MEEATLFWTMISAIATAIAAGATAVSAVVIAVQAVQTKRSVEEAKRSADASERAVNAANEALQLTRQQAKHSEIMAGEAIRSRMEAQGPAVSVSFSDVDDDGRPLPFGYAIGSKLDDDNYQQVEPGHVFFETRDDDQWLFAVVRVAFSNNGPHPVTVSTHTMTRQFRNRQLSLANRHVRLEGAGSTGRTDGGFMPIGAPVSQWVWVIRQSQRGHQVGGSTAWWTEIDGEAGIQITQTLKIMGTLLESGDRQGEWRLRGFGPDVNYPSSFVLEPQKRHYYIGIDPTGKRHALPPLEPEELAIDAP